MSQTRVKGKAILTGEYALMVGAGAIAFSTQGAITCQHKPRPTRDITIDSDEGKSNLSCQQLTNHARQLQQKYQQFLNQQHPISQVLTEPNDLIILTIFLASQTSPQQNQLLDKGFSLKLTSTLPIGSGMGSSAAVSSAILQSLLPHSSKSQILPLVKQSESYAHGKSGGLDAWMSVYSQSVWWYNQQAQPLNINTDSFHLIHTGTPQTSTATCIEQINKQFNKTHPIWEEFKQLSQKFKHYFNQHSNQQTPTQLDNLITTNHQLLTQLGVVPIATQQLIEEIQHAGGSAKTIGAGSIAGQYAGTILAHNLDQQTLKRIAHQHQATLLAD